MAPRAGFEPATNRLTAGCSTTELPGNDSGAITKPACFAKRERPATQVEATAGIEPACTDLQSAASPLRHVANRGKKGRQVPMPYIGAKAVRQSQPEPCVLPVIAAEETAFRAI